LSPFFSLTCFAHACIHNADFFFCGGGQLRTPYNEPQRQPLSPLASTISNVPAIPSMNPGRNATIHAAMHLPPSSLTQPQVLHSTCIPTSAVRNARPENCYAPACYAPSTFFPCTASGTPLHVYTSAVRNGMTLNVYTGPGACVFASCIAFVCMRVYACVCMCGCVGVWGWGWGWGCVLFV
jgi:hypothetical protein